MEDSTQLLLDGAKGLRSLADALELAADVINTHGFEALLGPNTKQPELIEAQVDEGKERQEEITLTLTDVRKILAEKSRAGHTDQVRLLLENYGADKLSAIDPSHYKNLVDEAECLGATLEDLKAAVDEKTKEGLAEWIPEVFKHHYSTSLEDLNPSHYPSFLRDIRRLRNE
jgi:dsDNA-binding SOS-regulon protein